MPPRDHEEPFLLSEIAPLLNEKSALEAPSPPCLKCFLRSCLLPSLEESSKGYEELRISLISIILNFQRDDLKNKECQEEAETR